MPLELMEHQEAGIAFLRTHPRAALLDQPGLGKSAQALLSAEGDTLIVGPAMVIDGGVWDDEIARWRPGLATTQVSYHSICRKDGRKFLPALAEQFKKPWGTVILDESHNIKNRQANWTRAIKKLETERMFLLSGTPIPNWAYEAYTQLCLLFPEDQKSGGRLGSYWRWAEEWFDIGELEDRAGRTLTKFNIEGLKPERTWEEFRRDNWKDRALLRLRSNCLDLPPMTEQTIHVDLTAEQKRVYRALKKDFVAWLDSGKEIAAWNQADQFMKLAQLATHLDGKGAKLDVLDTLLQDRPMPTIVVAHFRASALAAQKIAGRYGVARILTGETSKRARHEIVREFQSGSIDTLCATIDTISEGLTLTAADQVIYLEHSWRPSRNEQVKRRIHRIGTTHPVSAIHLVAKNTLDERVLDLLKEKTEQQLEALPPAEIKELL